MVDDDTGSVVGDPRTGVFIRVPTVGAVVISALRRGASLDEAATAAERCAGEPVDLDAFLRVLDDVGFLADESSGPDVQHSAPIQQRRWLAGPDPRWFRPLFSRVAWLGYGTAFLFSIACLILNPALLPSADDAFVSGEPGPSVLAVIPLACGLTALHESWHWLAARAAGITARFGIDRRLCFLVFETDLSQLWTLPRRKRYGPQLAGLAIDAVVLAVLLIFRLLERSGHLTVPPALDDLAAALILVMVMGMTWQCMVFLRTDLYGVLVTMTGCYNLWEVKTLLLRRAFRRPSPEQTAPLSDAHPRDLAVARWFRWLYLFGVPVALAYYAAFSVPVLIATGEWAWRGIVTGPAHSQFWSALATGIAVYSVPALVIAVWCVERLPHRKTASRR
ncbi:hypothetical protein LUW74_30830 [Actinomadura madurae]|uniref:hypothetical protein n=1 Tax=Actinomadura madurae TaxID=1993 RepID=UPI002025C8E9|nr:hypothetical protein [Actinomadura madurae]URN07295.1 hypothetical protein LUW74_30830 [Actinomadura madurae]